MPAPVILKRVLTDSRVGCVPQANCTQLEKAMSLSGVSSAPAAHINVSSAAVARAADGDYKAPNALSSQVKDKDGDYQGNRLKIRVTNGRRAESVVIL